MSPRSARFLPVMVDRRARGGAWTFQGEEQEEEDERDEEKQKKEEEG
jgi:hypothetical protein